MMLDHGRGVSGRAITYSRPSSVNQPYFVLKRPFMRVVSAGKAAHSDTGGWIPHSSASPSLPMPPRPMVGRLHRPRGPKGDDHPGESRGGRRDGSRRSRDGTNYRTTATRLVMLFPDCLSRTTT